MSAGKEAVDYFVMCNAKNMKESVEQARLGKGNVSGVWALFGKSKHNPQDWICLQVAKAKDIFAEVKVDCNLINSSDEICLSERTYINQFGEKCFPYYEYSSCRKQLYRSIRDTFSDLTFVCVGLEDDSKARAKLESDFAWLTCAKFWRNGGSFKEERNNYYQDTYDDSKIPPEIKEKKCAILEALNEYEKSLYLKRASKLT